MVAIKDLLKDKDIPFGDGKIAKAGTRLHSLMVGDMVRELEAKQDEEWEEYQRDIASAINTMTDLIADETVEAVVLKKKDDEFTVELVDNVRKIVIKSRVGKLKTQDSEEAE
tara:strand:+ start:109 stop:444 length:336 start_codon:yes stop_codon:yes gene_type:complete